MVTVVTLGCTTRRFVAASLLLRWGGIQRLSSSLPDLQSPLPGGVQSQQRRQPGGRPQTLALQHQSEPETRFTFLALSQVMLQPSRRGRRRAL